MKTYLLVGVCAAVLGGGVALAQMPPPGGDGQPGAGGPERMMMMHRMHHRWADGTRYRFRKGDAEVSIACSSQEPLQNCVNGAATLLDKLNTAQAKPAQ